MPANLLGSALAEKFTPFSSTVIKFCGDLYLPTFLNFFYPLRAGYFRDYQ